MNERRQEVISLDNLPDTSAYDDLFPLAARRFAIDPSASTPVRINPSQEPA